MTPPRTRSILITGCSSGIGYDCAHTMHRLGQEQEQSGWRVFATARKEEDVERLKSEGLESFLLDMDSQESIENAVEFIKGEGGVDALFNNAGYGQQGALEDLPVKALREQMETNFFGLYDLTQKIIPIMREKGGGHILFNSSVLGFVNLKFRGAYCISKYAVEGLADALRLELYGSNIHVGLVEPGPIKTLFRQNAYPTFRKYVVPEESVHADEYVGFEETLKKGSGKGKFSLESADVTKRCIQFFESSNPKARYFVTFPTKLFAFLKRVLPAKILDKLLIKAS